MRARNLVALTVAAAGLLGLLATAALRSRCPVDLKLVSIEPSGMVDDDGTESWLVTLSMSNCSAGVLIVAQESGNAQAKVAGRWVEAEYFSSIGDLAQHATKEVLLFVPSGTDACRLGIKYLPEPLHLRMMWIPARLGLWRYSWYRALACRVFPVGWLEPLRSDYIGRSPHWRLMSPKVTFPQRPAGRSGAYDRAHNTSANADGPRQLPMGTRWAPLLRSVLALAAWPFLSNQAVVPSV
jgi:hypothetical protein